MFSDLVVTGVSTLFEILAPSSRRASWRLGASVSTLLEILGYDHHEGVQSKVRIHVSTLLEILDDGLKLIFNPTVL